MTLKRISIWGICVATVPLFVFGCAGKSQMNHAEHMNMPGMNQQGSAKVNWLDFEEGQRRARAENKLMVVDFYVSEGCHRCVVMDKNVYGQAMIAERINRDFIPVRVDLQKRLHPEAKKLGKKYDFDFDCLLVVCDAEGNAVKDSISGRMCFSEVVKPQWFLSYLYEVAGLESDEDFFTDLENL